MYTNEQTDDIYTMFGIFVAVALVAVVIVGIFIAADSRPPCVAFETRTEEYRDHSVGIALFGATRNPGMIALSETKTREVQVCVEWEDSADPR